MYGLKLFLFTSCLHVYLCVRDDWQLWVCFVSALDKLLGQLGIYATWLSSIAYLQKQLRIFIIFTPRFFLL